ADNLGLDLEGKPVLENFGGITALANKPSWPNGLVAMPVAKAREYVLEHAGARPKDRDAVDRRIVVDVRSGTGKFLNSQDEVGGYPHEQSTTRTLKVPAENIDAWLE